MIILHFHLQPQFKNELFHILHIINVQLSNEACSEWSGLDLNIVLSVTLLS